MEAEIVRLQELVDDLAMHRLTEVEVLEAGCGSRTHIRFGEKARITGIDISAAQLLRNKDIAERILGDIQSYTFEPASFDIIICWDVLEHLRDPVAALRGFVNAAKQGGMIILGLPNVFSIKGLLTKYTPHCFHVWAYKHVFGIRSAGEEDQAPFRTVLSYSIAPSAIKKFALSHELRIVYSATYDTEFYKRRAVLFNFFKRLIKKLSLGALGDSDVVLALQKV